MKQKTKKYKSMSQKEILHFSTQNQKALVLSNKSGSTKPLDLFDLQDDGPKKAKAMLKLRKV